MSQKPPWSRWLEFRCPSRILNSSGISAGITERQPFTMTFLSIKCPKSRHWVDDRSCFVRQGFWTHLGYLQVLQKDNNFCLSNVPKAALEAMTGVPLSIMSLSAGYLQVLQKDKIFLWNFCLLNVPKTALESMTGVSLSIKDIELIWDICRHCRKKIISVY